MKTFLHVGCGNNRKDWTTRTLNTPDWKEQRLDINPSAYPDIVGTLQVAGFGGVVSGSRAHSYDDLWAVASKPVQLEELMAALADAHFPE